MIRSADRLHRATGRWSGRKGGRRVQRSRQLLWIAIGSSPQIDVAPDPVTVHGEVRPWRCYAAGDPSIAGNGGNAEVLKPVKGAAFGRQLLRIFMPKLRIRSPVDDSGSCPKIGPKTDQNIRAAATLKITFPHLSNFFRGKLRTTSLIAHAAKLTRRHAGVRVLQHLL